jgi:hypothetical protein
MELLQLGMPRPHGKHAIRRKQARGRLTAHTANCLAIHIHDHLLLTGSLDRTLKLFDLRVLSAATDPQSDVSNTTVTASSAAAMYVLL